MRHLFFITSILVLGSGAALAQNPAVPATPATSEAPKPKEKLICENVEEIGSRLSTHKVCMTRAQRDAERRENRDIVSHVQSQHSCVNGC